MLDVNTVYQMDCLELMKQIDDASIDLILCDPPYAVHEAEWDKPIDIEGFWREIKRIIKPRHAVVITCVMRLAWQLIAANPDWFKYDMVGIKNVPTDFMNAHNKPMRMHENILVFSDGTTANHSDNRMVYYPQVERGEPYQKTDYAKTRINDVWGGKGRKAFEFDQIRQNNGTRLPTTLIKQKVANYEGNLHPNEKPLDLFEYFVRTYTEPGMLVLDCFAGSGTTGRACQLTGRQYILGDSDAGYCEIARKRLSEPFTLPLFPDVPAPVASQQLALAME